MKTIHLPLAALVCILAAAPIAMADPADDSAAVRDLLNRAELHLRLGVSNYGADRALREAHRLLGSAEEMFAKTELPLEERQNLSLEIEAVREETELFTELFEERFYGVFPLARLTVPTLLIDGGSAFTEQLFHPPDEAAVEAATRASLAQIEDFLHPHVVVTSLPTDRALESVVTAILLQDGRTTVHTRREIVGSLGAEDLQTIDDNDLNSKVIDRLMRAFDIVKLMVLTVGEPNDLVDADVYSLRRDLFIPGEVVQGSPAEASLQIRTESSEFLGYARDRRAQSKAIVVTQLFLFGLAMAWAARVPWSVDHRLRVFVRIAIGAGFFAFGRILMIIGVFLLMKFKPDPGALVDAAWWWPALLGLWAVLGCGLAAWIGQARLTDIVPGARGARAVGSIFTLVAMGSGSYFVAPLLLYDELHGFASLIPFILASVAMAMLFGFAARTGPPVPHYFTLGPLLVAPLLGVCLLMVSPNLLWITAALAGILCLAAWFRHHYAVAHGTEEPEPTPEAAAQADQEKLDKVSKQLGEKV
jgi:hypothetical protein